MRTGKKQIVITAIILPALSVLVLFSLGYYAPKQGFANHSVDTLLYEIYVIQERWHTGIVIKTEDIDSEIWPEAKQYKNRKYIVVGWGDEAFYQSNSRLFILGARAILYPTSSVMMIASYSYKPISTSDDGSSAIRFLIEGESFEKLCSNIFKHLRRDDGNELVRSIFTENNSRFFLSEGKYHLFNTCNTWVARIFKETGFKVKVCCILNRRQLFKQLSSLAEAEVIR